ncbi:MAG: DUF2851 family protein [Crocinitomicaceae bacterium]|jgi:hypothetical protein
MKEEWLHFIWKMKRLPINLKTKKGELIEIIHPGSHNKDSGPDFFEASIRINNLLWSGNVEIHIRSSDWLKHKHQFDDAYNNVILHVVYIHDMEVSVNNEIIPVLELSNFIPKEELDKIEILFENQNTIACASQWNFVPTIIKHKEIESAFFRRLERKSICIVNRLSELNNDVMRLKLELLGKIIASKVNELPMIELLSRVSSSILFRLSSDQRITLLLGISGLIPIESEDNYVINLKKEADYLILKYNLTVMNSTSWIFFGCRPPAYPTLRIVVFALLIEDDFLLRDFENKKLMLDWVENKRLEFPDFWKTKTHFKDSNNKKTNSLSKELKTLIITNFIIPFSFWKYSTSNEIELLEELVELANELPPEKNAKVQKFKKLGQKTKSIFETQGLLELLNDFCVNKRCLNCQIGVKLLNS